MKLFWKKKFAWVNLFYGEPALALILAFQIRQKSRFPLIFLCPEQVPTEVEAALSKLGASVRRVEPIRLEYKAGDDVWNFRYHLTLAKLHAWKLTEFDQIGIIDSDIIFRDSLDRLPELPKAAELSACLIKDGPAAGRFNSGVMCARPNVGTYKRLIEFAHHGRYSKKLPDQNLLGEFWRTTGLLCDLPEEFNERRPERYGDASIYHFAGPKPWVAHHRKVLSHILPDWDRMVSEVKAELTTAGFDSDRLLSSIRTVEFIELEDRQAQFAASLGVRPK